jgi:hypothetical protein
VRPAFAHDVEMMIEAGNLVDLGLRHAQFLGQRGQVRGRQAAVLVLDQVQALDQQVAPARHVAQEGQHFGQGLRIDPPALGRLALALFACALHCDRNDYLVHLFSSQLGV